MLGVAPERRRAAIGNGRGARDFPRGSVLLQTGALIGCTARVIHEQRDMSTRPSIPHGGGGTRRSERQPTARRAGRCVSGGMWDGLTSAEYRMAAG